jgi:hypothetical protein
MFGLVVTRVRVVNYIANIELSFSTFLNLHMTSSQ